MVEDNSAAFEIDDESENWRGQGENHFNHKVLVMKAIDTCLTKGAVEMIEGYWDTKIDKNGNAAKTYHTDTRREFIESVKCLMMLVHRDYKDYDSIKKIDNLIKKVKDRKIFWLNQESAWWNELNNMQKQQMIQAGKNVNAGMFNKALDFDNFFHDEEIDVYREIFSEISDFIKDKMNDYEGEVYKG